MVSKPANTKRGDTETVLAVNMNVNGNTGLAAYARDAADNVISLPVYVESTGASRSEIAVITADLPVGKYKLEVEFIINDKRVTFPDTGYLVLSVNQDLGDLVP